MLPNLTPHYPSSDAKGVFRENLTTCSQYHKCIRLEYLVHTILILYSKAEKQKIGNNTRKTKKNIMQSIQNNDKNI